MKDSDYHSFVLRVSCMTYNHSSCISDAFDGFVMQQTSFPFVCTIIDDASTDGTQEVIREYLRKCFDLQNPEVSSENETSYGKIVISQHKSNRNCFFVVLFLNDNHFNRKQSKYVYLPEWKRTRYIAFCEGDDYWTDPLKLQKQVDYMESRPDCMLTVHSANWKTGEDLYPSGCQDSFAKDFSVEELILCGGYYFATASFVIRSKLNLDWPEWRRMAGVGDFPLQILAGLRGNVHYLPDRMCVYRYQNEGSWSSNQKRNDVFCAFQKRKIEWMTLLDEDTDHKYQSAIYDQLLQHYRSLFLLREIGFTEYAKAYMKSSQKKYGRLVKDFLKVYVKPRFQSS